MNRSAVLSSLYRSTRIRQVVYVYNCIYWTIQCIICICKKDANNFVTLNRFRPMDWEGERGKGKRIKKNK